MSQAPKVIGSSGKILKSGPNDRVFVYYADHGAPGELSPTPLVLLILSAFLTMGEDIVACMESWLPCLQKSVPPSVSISW